MSNTLSLDDLRAEARRRYQPVVVELPDDSTVELKPLLRLGKKARLAVQEALEEMKALQDIESDEFSDDEDEIEQAEEVAEKVSAAISKILRLVASSPRKLIAELDREEDVLVRSSQYTSILKVWAGGTQLGEAASSPS